MRAQRAENTKEHVTTSYRARVIGLHSSSCMQFTFAMVRFACAEGRLKHTRTPQTTALALRTCTRHLHSRIWRALENTLEHARHN
jgi:hypothetical protein